MSYTVIVNNVPVLCDSPDEALDLVMCVGMRSDPPPQDARAPGADAAPAQASGETTRHYSCTKCGHHRAVTAARHTKVVMCQQPGCHGECAPSEAPGAP